MSYSSCLQPCNRRVSGSKLCLDYRVCSRQAWANEMRPSNKIKGRESWGHGLKGRYLLSMCEALVGSISSTTITTTKRSLALKTLTRRNIGIRSKIINRKSCCWPLEWLASVDKKMQLSGLERWLAQGLRLFSDLPEYLDSVHYLQLQFQRIRHPLPASSGSHTDTCT